MPFFLITYSILNFISSVFCNLFSTDVPTIFSLLRSLTMYVHSKILLTFFIIKLVQLNLDCSPFQKKFLFSILTLSATSSLELFSLFSMSKSIYVVALTL